jgi:arylformamidase
MTEIYDVSIPLREGMVIYPGDPPFAREEYRSIAQGASSTNSRLTMGAHTGTHVDAPRHFIDGAASIEAIPPELLVGPCRVFEVNAADAIEAADLEPLDWRGVTRALFKTRNSALWALGQFDERFVHLTRSSAEFLVQRGVRVVGVDYLSVDRFHSPDHPAHMVLLGAGVVVIEGLNLTMIEEGDYELVCAPLLLTGGEAAPARVFLRR